MATTAKVFKNKKECEITMPEIRQVDLKTFRAMYGIPENTVERWIHKKGFPAYKQGHKWYIDIRSYEKWREIEHVNSYKYA